MPLSPTTAACLAAVLLVAAHCLSAEAAEPAAAASLLQRTAGVDKASPVLAAPAAEEKAPEAAAPETKEAPKSEVNQTEAPAAPAEAAQPGAGCVTRQDPRARAWWSMTAKPGTACVFGADPRDEGKHCIPEMEYGTMGWCYTKKDKSEWGSCGDGCPLYGPHKVIGKQIQGVSTKLDAIVGNMTKETEKADEVTAASAASNETKKPEKAAENATNATSPNPAAAPNKTEAEAPKDPKAAALSEKSGGASKAGKSGRKNQKKHNRKGDRKAVSFVQVSAHTDQAAGMAKVDAALAKVQKAERQTELWTGIAERVLLADGSAEDEDSIPLAEEALKKARAWQRIADKEGALADALMAAA